MLPPAQLFLRDLDGRSLLISFGARASVPACEVLAAAAAACRLPLPQLRLFTGSAVLSWRSEADTRLLFAAPEGLLPSCSLLLPLCGGKARVLHHLPTLFALTSLCRADSAACSAAQARAAG